MNWSCSSLRTPALHYIVRSPSSTLIWIDSHPIVCCFLFFWLLLFPTVIKCAFWVTFLVATIAASWWTNSHLHCCCVSPGGALVEAPVVRLNLAPIAPGWIVSVAMTCWCEKVRKMFTKRSGKYWRLYSLLQVKMEWVTVNLHVQFKLNPATYSCTAYSYRGFQWSSNLQ